MIIQGVTLAGVTVVDQILEIPFTPQQLLTNPSFDSGTTGWTASGGFGAYSYTSSNQIAVLDGIAYFTYVSRTLSQTVNVSNIVQDADVFTAVVNIRHREKSDAATYTSIDTYTFQVVFRNAAGTAVATKTTGSTNAPQNFTDVPLVLNRSEIPATFNTITTVQINLTGVDSGFWNGNHGPMVDYITLTAS